MENRKLKWLPWLIVIVVLSLGLNIYYFAHHRAAGTGSETASGKQMYQCPMHPQIIQDHPGDCPICGMKLVPVKKGTTAAAPQASAAEPAVDVNAATAAGDSITVYECPMKDSPPSDKPGKCPVCGMKLKPVKVARQAVQTAEHKILFYRNPMDPSITSPVPAKDEMGMDYVPVYADEMSNAASSVEGRAEVTIDPTRQQLIGLRTAVAERAPVSGSWRTIGRVVVDPTQIAKVNVKVQGYVEKVYADFVGEPVRRGQALFTLYSPELLTAQQEYLLALKSHTAAFSGDTSRSADALVMAARQKLKLWDVSDAQIRKLEQTGEATRTVIVVSPVSGVVTVKNVVEGASLNPGDSPYEITDLSEVWVLADVYQSDLSRVKVGMPATFSPSSYPGQTYRGKVAFLDPLLDPVSRTLKVRLNFPNPNGELKPEMFGDVALEGASRDALTIPSDALIPTGTRYMVFVSLGNGKFEPRAVEIGKKADERVEVVSGLKEGDEVVTRANFLIDSESSLRAALAAVSQP